MCAAGRLSLFRGSFCVLCFDPDRASLRTCARLGSGFIWSSGGVRLTSMSSFVILFCGDDEKAFPRIELRLVVV